LAEELTEDDLIIPGSSGIGIDAFWLSFKVKSGQRLFSTGGLGAMGFGLPASIGGCLAHGRKRTISVDGDGGFQLNIQELETVSRMNLPIKFFILNNQGYASIRATQKNYFGRLVGADATSGLTLPNIIQVASAYSLKTARITDHTDIYQQVRQVLELPGPVVCEVMVAPDQSVGPRITSVIRSDGSMVSKPLEDMWPFLDRQEFLSNMIVQPVNE
jgi:acetolactate synthase-1/2/3 large subunit